MLSRTALCIQHQALTRTNAVSQRIVSRSLHLTCRIKNTTVRTNSVLTISKYAPVLGAYSKRHSSTTEAANATTNQLLKIIETPGKVATANAPNVSSASTSIGENVTSSVVDTLPDIPIPPAPTVLETVSYLGEPPFESLGLGGWWPVGLVQHSLEYLHVGLGLPWWECIAIATLVLRTALFPLVIISQRNAAKMSNNMPEMQRIQENMTEARQCGDQIKSARHAQEMMAFMKEKGCNPLKNMIVPLAQAPIFISCFLGLRRMAECPVESMKEGGLWWFTDLTIPDPYYILPLITAGTLALTIEIGTDSARAQAMGMMRYVFRALPVIILPFTLHFSGAILCYWVSSNFISLIQVGFLRVPKIRTFFKIEPLITHSPKALVGQKGFVEGFKSSWSNMKATREMNARVQVDEVQFFQAGRGPLRKTYPYDPTKQTSTQQTANAILAKKR